MRRLVTLLFLLVAVVAVAQEDEPFWAFEGVLPTSFEVHIPVPRVLYSAEGHPLTVMQVQSAMDIRLGDPVVLIRDGAVAGKGKVDQVIARLDEKSRTGRVLHMRLSGLAEGLTVPSEPRGAKALAAGTYDLMVITDKAVEILAPDPAFGDITWGTQDYVVRVGRKRYAVIRENAPRSDGFRGWQVSRLNEDGTSNRMTADYTWWEQ